MQLLGRDVVCYMDDGWIFEDRPSQARKGGRVECRHSGLTVNSKKSIGLNLAVAFVVASSQRCRVMC